MKSIDIMTKGDRVLSVTESFIAIQKKTGEIVLLPIAKTDTGIHVELEKMITISYGGNMIETVTVDGIEITNI